MTAAPRVVVCFGDSNSYGTPAMPNLDAWDRFPPGVRWPGVMGRSLGTGWQVIEEALPGRTTVHDDPIEGRDKNGLSALPIVLGSHRPIDLLVIMLGTNDLKARFSVTPEDIAASVECLVTMARATAAGPEGRPPGVMVVVPVPIVETGCLAGMFHGGGAKSRQLGRCYRAMTDRLGVSLLDAGAFAAVDPLDGVHLAADAHAAIGGAVAKAILDAGL